MTFNEYKKELYKNTVESYKELLKDKFIDLTCDKYKLWRDNQNILNTFSAIVAKEKIDMNSQIIWPICFKSSDTVIFDRAKPKI